MRSARVFVSSSGATLEPKPFRAPTPPHRDDDHAIQQARGGGIRAWGVAQRPERGNDDPTKPIIALDAQGCRPVHPADDKAGVHAGLEIQEIAALDHVLRNDAIKCSIDQRTARYLRE